MRRITRQARTPIGIDVGAKCIKAAQLSRAPGGWRVEAVASFAREQPGAALDRQQVRRLRDVLYRRGFTGKGVVLAAPSESLMTGVLELPPRSSGAPLDQIARMELARIHKCQPQSFEMAYWDLPAAARAKDTATAMAAACTHAHADLLLDAFEKEGLDVQALDIHACALARACEPLVSAGDNITGLLDIGWESVQLVLLYQGVVVYERTLREMGVGPLAGVMKEQFDLDADTVEALLDEVGFGPDAKEAEGAWQSFEAVQGTGAAHLDLMVDELRGPFSYAAHQYPDVTVERLLVVGGGASIPGLKEHAASALGMGVQAVAPRDVADCAPAVVEECGQPVLMASIGLASFFEE